MPFAYSLDPGSIVEVRYLGLLYTQTIMTVLHYQVSDTSPSIADGPTQVDAIAAEFASDVPGSVFEALLNCQTADVQYYRIEAQYISPARWAKKVRATALVGAIEGTALPSNVSADLTKRTEVARQKTLLGVGGVGTLHLAGVPQDSVLANVLNNIYRNGPLTALSAALETSHSVTGQTLRPVIYHRKRAGDLAATLITSVTPEPYSRTMRRRGPLLGI